MHLSLTINTELIIKISKKHQIEIIQQVANKNLKLSIQEKYNKEKLACFFPIF